MLRPVALSEVPASPTSVPAPANGSRLLTVADVAERLGVTKDWVWAQARAGRIPHVQLGRYRRFREEAIDEWLRRLEAESVKQLASDASRRKLASVAKRPHGTGHLYEKHGAWYGRWRTPAGRWLNRKLGPVRPVGERSGLTRSQAEREFRRLQDEEERRPTPARGSAAHTLDEAADSLRRQLALEGSRKSYLEGCESMQRVHLAPRLGERPLGQITTADVEALAAAMLELGRAPKTVRNVLTFLHSVFEHAIARGWARENPVRHAARPRRRRSSDADPDLHFLTVPELDAVMRSIPDEIVTRAPAATRRGRPGPAPPPPPDVLGPVLRPLILAAAMTGLRQSELIGLRWRDVDFAAQRIRVRNTYVRGEHSGEGKSDLSTRRSVPMASRLTAELARWSQRTVFSSEVDLVFAHPQTGNPLDRSKVTKRFKAACVAAGVRPVRFHDLRHTFGTQLVASGTALRPLQEWLGHADSKTTQIYTLRPERARGRGGRPCLRTRDGDQNGDQTERN